MGRYLAYLIAVGFLPAPPTRSETESKSPNDEKKKKGQNEERIELASFILADGQKNALAKVGGRGGMV